MDTKDIDPFVSSFVDSTLKGMKKFVQEGEEVAPQVILFANEGEDFAIIPLIGVGEYFMSKEGKRKLPGVVKKAWGNISSINPMLKLCAIVLLSDAWVETVSIPEFEQMYKHGRKTEFEPKPGMAEALILILSVGEGEFQYQWPYVRGNDEVVFTPEPIMQKSSEGPRGFLMGLWPL